VHGRGHVRRGLQRTSTEHTKPGAGKAKCLDAGLGLERLQLQSRLSLTSYARCLAHTAYRWAIVPSCLVPSGHHSLLF
jgi:hypothetical protein